MQDPYQICKRCHFLEPPAAQGIRVHAIQRRELSSLEISRRRERERAQQAAETNILLYS
jgi:hypothetical protein